MLKMGISVAGHTHQHASSAPSGWGDVRHCTGTQGSPGPIQPSGQFGTGVLHGEYIYEMLAGLGFSPEVQHGCVVGILLCTVGTEILHLGEQRLLCQLWVCVLLP